MRIKQQHRTAQVSYKSALQDLSCNILLQGCAAKCCALGGAGHMEENTATRKSSEQRYLGCLVADGVASECASLRRMVCGTWGT